LIRIVIVYSGAGEIRKIKEDGAVIGFISHKVVVDIIWELINPI
jgi:hypothetical protein